MVWYYLRAKVRMHTRNRSVSLVLLGISVALAAVDQGPPKDQAQPDPGERLGFMVGDWQGEGWMIGPDGQRLPFRGGETVQRKIQNKALLVEGVFRAKVGPEQVERVVHETLGVISYDRKMQQYRFRTYLARGGSGDTELKLTGERAWEWSPDGGGGPMVRYRTSFADGDWYEVGERSKDGKTWEQFFEMRLKKVPS